MCKIEINRNWYQNRALLNWIICIYIHVTVLNQSILGHACSSSLIDNETCSNIVIKIGSLFDIDGRRPDWMGFSELIAAKIAEKHFNEASKNYKIELLVNDSKVGV